MKLTKILSISLIGLLGFSLAACGDDEPDDNNNNVVIPGGNDGPDNGPGNGSDNGPNNSDVASAIIDFDGKALSYVADNVIYYDRLGRVEAVYGHYDEYLEIDYSRGKIDIEGDEGTIKFNNNGYISEIFFTYDGVDGNERYSGNSKFEYAYDASGYLTDINFFGSETIRNTSTMETSLWESTTTITLVWSGGNLLSTSWREIEKDDGEIETWTGKYNISYGSQKNEFRQIPYVISDYAIFDWCPINALASTGLFGRGPKSLPVSFDEIDEGEYDYTIDLAFDLNSNGSIGREYFRYSIKDSYQGNLNYYDYGYESLNPRAQNIKASVKKGGEKKSLRHRIMRHKNKKTTR